MVNLSRSKQRNNDKNAILFLFPLMLIVGILLFYSIFFIIKNSFFNFDLSFQKFTFVGLNNYARLLTDPIFYKSIFNNLVFSGVVILAGVTLGFLFAVLLSTNIRGNRLFFAILFLPSIVPRALIATVFKEMLEFHSGTVNAVLSFMGMNVQNLTWLTDPGMAYVSVFTVLIYMIGIPLLYYNAELTTIDSSIFESAQLDGANFPTLITKIIFPLVKASHKTIVISTLLATFRMFEVIFLLTSGGPGFTTEITGTYIYRFTRRGSDLGYVSAAATIILVIALFLSVLQIKLLYKSKKN
ncbi:sugar ABC transporter permease [Oceanispirochaeta crateris]|uniref:Sugar ABC transporter permease n=1 Tax=Oceanispirochaeta crateris TaxID=2518645 RepID=A0A5C1QMW1_9SPIO|nr:sugar ABC transporter permease [Oceanispirochaeta crateris]